MFLTVITINEANLILLKELWKIGLQNPCSQLHLSLVKKNALLDAGERSLFRSLRVWTGPPPQVPGPRSSAVTRDDFRAALFLLP